MNANLINFKRLLSFKKKNLVSKLLKIKNEVSNKLKFNYRNYKRTFSLCFLQTIISFLFYQKVIKEKQINKSIQASSSNQEKFIIKNEPIIIIYYDGENILQKELVEIVKKKLVEDYFGSNSISSIPIEVIDINTTSKLLEIDHQKLKSQNEPLLVIQMVMNISKQRKLINTSIDALSFTGKNNDKIIQKLNNLLLIKNVNSLIELRDEFRYLENPRNKVIIIHPSVLETVQSETLCLFRDKRIKIITINDQNLLDFCGIDQGMIYTYYPSKLPYKMKDTETYINEYMKRKNYNQFTDAHEFLTKQGIDLNAYLNSNPVELMLKFGMFRDEIKISKDLIDNLTKNEFFVLSPICSLQEKVKLQKLVTYPKRYVTKLAEIESKVIEKQIKTQNKHLLFIYVPNWSNLKENIFETILYESSHLFDSIMVSNSKNFSFKNDLYDDTQISEEVPQIYLIETNNLVDRKVYSLSYFRFPDDFNKYLKNKKEVFKKPELMENLTYVTTLNSKNFEEKIFKDKSFKEFLIEVKHEGCPTCYMLGKMFDHVSQKMKKHKYDKNIKMFRVDTHNDLPYLGEFAATPTYLFCRKSQDGKIEFISQVDKSEFIFKIKKLSKYDLTKLRYHPNIGFGYYLFQRNEFLKESYDPDLDISGFNI